MPRPPTMKDIARAAGTSVMTVSRAFRSDASVSEETRERIRAVADELGYVLDSTAAALRSQRTGFVAATVPSLDNANFADTIRGLTDGLEPQGREILLGYTGYNVAEEERLIGQLLRRRPEALVVTGGKHTERARRLMTGAGIPVVETWDLPEAPLGHVVGFSNAAAVREMVEHFAARGYRRIAFIGGDAGRDSRGTDRRQGFIAAMERLGLDATRLIAAGEPPISMREGAEAMARLLALHPDTEAVICVSDLSAFGALSECQRRGVAVPGRIAIGGFGNYEIGTVSVPRLTTIDAHAYRIGREAAAVILAALDGRQAPARVEIAPRLLVRETSR